MKKRMESLAGKMLVTSSPGKGCTITIEVPYTNPADAAADAGPF